MSRLEEIGILHYDIPEGLNNYWYRVQRVLRNGAALQASKSVYLVNWADVPRVQGMIDAAKADFADKYPDRVGRLHSLQMNFLKFDDATSEEAHAMAVEGLGRLINEVGCALKERIAKAKAKGEAELPRRAKRQFAKRIQECEGLAIAFRLTDDVDVALEAAKKAVLAEIGVEVYEDVAEGRRKKPVRKKKGDAAEAQEGTKEEATPATEKPAEPEKPAKKKEPVAPRVSAMFAPSSS